MNNHSVLLVSPVKKEVKPYILLTWSQDLTVENRFSMFENKPLMRINGSGRGGS
jgi:hypothetical protein